LLKVRQKYQALLLEYSDEVAQQYKRGCVVAFPWYNGNVNVP